MFHLRHVRTTLPTEPLPEHRASPKGQRFDAMVTRKLGPNCTAFSTHIPICHSRNTLGSGPQSPSALRGCYRTNEHSCSASPSWLRSGKIILAFQNNGDNEAFMFPGMLLFFFNSGSIYRIKCLHSVWWKHKSPERQTGNLSHWLTMLSTPGRELTLALKREQVCTHVHGLQIFSLIHFCMFEWRSPWSTRLLSGSGPSPTHRNGFIGWWVSFLVLKRQTSVSIWTLWGKLI